jgi:hypothetical protein
MALLPKVAVRGAQRPAGAKIPVMKIPVVAQKSALSVKTPPTTKKNYGISNRGIR